MKKVILILGYFLVLILTLIMLGYFFPFLTLDLQLQDIEKIIFRFLASFSYFGDPKQFWILVGVSTGIYEICLILAVYKVRNSLNSIAFNIVGVIALVNYFFWVLSNKISPSSGHIRFILPDDFFGKIVIYISILIALGLLNILILPKIIGSNRSEQNMAQSSPMIYMCPDCRTPYYSNVTYCTHCQKSITPTQFIDQSEFHVKSQETENSL